MLKNFLKSKKNSIIIAFLLVASLGGYYFLSSTHVVAYYINTDDSYYNNIMYNDVVYYPVFPDGHCICDFAPKENLGRVDNRFGDSISSLKYDNDSQYLYIRQSGDGIIYSKTNSEIGLGSKITAIYLGDDIEDRITVNEDMQFLISLNNLQGESYTYKSEGSKKFSLKLSCCYDNSAIATNILGYLAHTDDDQWVYVPRDGSNANDGVNRGFIIKDQDDISEIKRITMNVDSFY